MTAPSSRPSTGPRVALAVAAVALAACVDTLGPDVGEPIVQPGTCTITDSNPDVDVLFQTELLAGVFAQSEIDCARCHTGEGEGLRTSGFDTSSYTTVRAGGAMSGASIVVAGNPCRSILYQKLGPSPPFGARMPRNGPPYLSDADLQRVADWILEGARDN